MKKVLLLLAVASVAAMGADIRGSYLEARNADVYVAHCFANAELNLAGDLAVMAWRVEQGSWNNVTLDGLGVVAVVRASGTLGDPFRSAYPAKSVLILDERANAEQRAALQGFAKKMAGDLVQTVTRVETAPIAFDFGSSIHAATARMTAGSLARIETRPLRDGDAVCHNAYVYYPPLTRLSHSMPAHTVDNRFSGRGLDAEWSSPSKNSSFLGIFAVPSE